MPKTPFVLFDLEYATDEDARDTGWGMLGQHKEVIQIGAAIITPGGDWNSFPKFNKLVKHQFTEHNDYTTNLTGITEQMLEEEGLEGEDAFRQFAMFIGNLPTLSNGNDVNQLNETCGLQGFKRPYNIMQFGTLHEELYGGLTLVGPSFNQKDYPSGLVHELLDIPLLSGLGQAHNAMRDVWSLHVTIEELDKQGFDVIGKIKQRMMMRKLRMQSI